MGESIAEGTMSRWLKKVGDAVKRDEPIFEISTDKVDAEIPSPTAGVLAEVLVTEGQTVPVQTVVARIETEAGAAATVSAPAPAPAASAPAAAAPATAASGGPPPKSQSTAKAASGPHPTPALTPAALQPTARPSGNGGSVEERLRTKSSPLVRKIAAEHGIEIAGLQGSGIAGRVTKRDIMQVIESGAPAAAPRVAPPSMHAPAGVEPHGPLPEPWAGDVVEPMSRIRALTAEHMSLSRRTNAHVTSFFEIDLTRVARIRAKLRADFEKQSGEKLTYLPFILTAVTGALKEFPILNAAVAWQQHNLPETVQPRHRRRARLGAHRPGDQARRRAVAGRPNETAQRPREPRSRQEAPPRGSPGRDVHDHKPGRVRIADGHPDHSGSDDRDTRHRRHREAPEGPDGTGR
jgi:2-oxoglutarate dehydrogenase E2 component (dihydrolipoamide succinyltransferase)